MPALSLNQAKKWIVNNVDDFAGNIIDSFGISLNNAGGTISTQRGEVYTSNLIFPHTIQTTATSLSTMVGMDQCVYSNADLSGAYFAIDTVGVYKTSTITTHFALDTFTDSPVPKGDIVVFGRTGGFDNLIVATAMDLYKLHGGSAWTPDYWTNTLGQLPLSNGNAPTAGSGTISSSGTTVSGSSTLFSSQVHVGDYIIASGIARRVTVVTNNTTITTAEGFSPPIAGGTSYTIQSKSNPTVVHPLAVMQQPFLLLIGDGNLVHTVDQNAAATYARVTLMPSHSIEWIRATQTQVFIGVVDTNKGYPGVYTYDPVSEQVVFYPMTFPGVGSGAPLIHEESLFILACDGRLKVFNGGGFDTISETPYSKKNLFFSSIHRNAAGLSKNLFYFILRNGASTKVPDGLYVYDTVDQNFYHTAPVTLNSGDAGQLGLNATQGLFVDANDMLFGVQNTAGTKKGIYSLGNDFGVSAVYRAWFITPRMQASPDVIQTIWRKIWAKYRLYGSSTIEIKARVALLQQDNVAGTAILSGTWTSTTTFTTSNDISAAVVGNEFIIYDETNASKTAYITAISVVAGTYTVTIDTAIGQNSGNFDFIITNFTNVDTITNVSKQSQALNIKTTVPNNSEWIQFKVQFNGAGGFLDDLILELESSIVVK